MSDIVEVAVAAIINSHNEVLISLRADHVHQGGLWEFPGGKQESGETIEQTLYREIKEELNISIQAAQPLITAQHDYHDKTVRLHVWKVTNYSPLADYNFQTLGAEGQKIKWQPIHSLDVSAFPAADKSIISALKLPDQYLITGSFQSLEDFETRLLTAIGNGIRLLQLRLKPSWVNANVELARQVLKMSVDLCEKKTITLMLNIPDDLQITMWSELENSNALDNIGLHLDSVRLNEVSEISVEQYAWCTYVSASCHTQEDLNKAKALDVDFIVLSPVKKTASHPDAVPLGWQAFAEYVKGCEFPVYALGGVEPEDIETAREHGAQGIAGIRYAW